MIPVTCDPEGKLDRVPLDELEEFQGNLKSLGVTEYNKLKQSITEKGFIVPCFAWRNGSSKWQLLDGHQRVRVIRKEGWQIDGGIPIVEILADNERDAKEKLLVIIGRYGRIEGQGLYEFLDGTGIDLEEWTVPDLPDLDLESWLDEFMRDPEVPPGDPEAVPEVPEEATTQRGDLWVLGDHRVLCGDATSVDDVEKLMGGECLDLCFTSPPYNMGANAELHGNTKLTDSKYINDDDNKTEKDYADFLSQITAIALKHVRVVIVNIQWLANNKIACIDYLHKMRHSFIDVAIWDKQHAAPAMARNVMSSQFEFLYLFTDDPSPSRAISTANFRGTVPNVYSAAPQRNNESSSVHAATFPIHLPEWAIVSFSEKGDVYDPFLGSGTTLIAAEKQGRRCFGLEIDPKYVDVIVKRWEDYTGGTAVLEQSKAA